MIKVPFKLRLIREKNRLYRMILSFFSMFSPKSSRVYLFHDILVDKSKVNSIFSISKNSFEKFLLQKLKEGKKPLNFDELSDIIIKNIHVKNGFYISFDDANESVYTQAYPFLKEHNIPFIIFITIELIGKPNYLNIEQIKELSADPLCTVGAHGVRHVMFRYLSNRDTEQELINSKKALEKLIGKEVQTFAFPYGRVVECSRNNIQVLKNSSYDFAFSALKGTLNEKWISGKYFLPRINVDESMVK